MICKFVELVSHAVPAPSSPPLSYTRNGLLESEKNYMCSQTEIELIQFFFKDCSVCNSERAAASEDMAFVGTL